MSQVPVNDDEWTIHSINIHGAFFERLCRRIVEQTEGWRIASTNYPVEFPRGGASPRSHESAADIWAQHWNQRGHRVSAVIECKKCNPDFVNWIFFPRRRTRRSNSLHLRAVSQRAIQGQALGWRTDVGMVEHWSQLDFADDARETRSSYADYKRQDKTRTANAAITEAAFQVALATQCLHAQIAEESEALNRRAIKEGTRQRLPYPIHWLLPVIVTSAHLYLCEFDAANIDPGTGELDLAKATLTEKPALIYEYALPRSLHYSPPGIDFDEVIEKGEQEQYMRMHIFVVHSEQLSTMLDQNFGVDLY